MSPERRGCPECGEWIRVRKDGGLYDHQRTRYEDHGSARLTFKGRCPGSGLVLRGSQADVRIEPRGVVVTTERFIESAASLEDRWFDPQELAKEGHGVIYGETKYRTAVRNEDKQIAKPHPYDEHLEMLNRGEKIHCWCLTGRYVVGVETNVTP